jgi:hypothetical protein
MVPYIAGGALTESRAQFGASLINDRTIEQII